MWFCQRKWNESEKVSYQTKIVNLWWVHYSLPLWEVLMVLEKKRTILFARFLASKIIISKIYSFYQTLQVHLGLPGPCWNTCNLPISRRKWLPLLSKPCFDISWIVLCSPCSGQDNKALLHPLNVRWSKLYVVTTVSRSVYTPLFVCSHPPTQDDSQLILVENIQFSAQPSAQNLNFCIQVLANPNLRNKYR